MTESNETHDNAKEPYFYLEANGKKVPFHNFDSGNEFTYSAQKSGEDDEQQAELPSIKKGTRTVAAKNSFYYDGTAALIPGGIAQTAAGLIESMMMSYLELIDWPVEITHEVLPGIHHADAHLQFAHTEVVVYVKFINPKYEEKK